MPLQLSNIIFIAPLMLLGYKEIPQTRPGPRMQFHFINVISFQLYRSRDIFAMERVIRFLELIPWRFHFIYRTVPVRRVLLRIVGSCFVYFVHVQEPSTYSMYALFA